MDPNLGISPPLEGLKIAGGKRCIKQLLGGNNVLTNGQQLNAFRIKPLGTGGKEGSAAAGEWIKYGTLRDLVFVEYVFNKWR